MVDIDLSKYKDNLTIKNIDGKSYIFDPIRKKYIRFLPEELVRQLLIQYFLMHNVYPASHIQVEKQLIINERQNRFDLLIYNKEMKPAIIVECKAPSVVINQSALDQISRYNMSLDAQYLIVTNGRETFCYNVDTKNESLRSLDKFPSLK